MSRILPVILVFIAIGLFFGYINPTYTGRVAQLRAEVQSYDAALSAAEAFSLKENELLAERGSIPAEGLSRVEAFLPDSVDNVQLIVDLNSLASRSGLSLSNFDTNVTSNQNKGDALSLASQSPIESLDLSVSAIGSYTAFKSFLSGAERSLRPLDLVDLTIDDSKTGVYAYTMTFRIYWLR